jgi:hypothetical protein
LDIGQFNRYEHIAHYEESFTPFVRAIARPKFEAKLRKRNGRRLNSVVCLRHRVTELFYEVPEHLRRHKIPEWYPDLVSVPKYLFRIKGKSLAPKQVIVSTMARLYFSYRFHIGRGQNSTNRLIRISRYEDIPRLLSCYRGRGWYTACQMVYRRLKVLLCPYRTQSI